MERAREFAPAGHHALMIPESAFRKALDDSTYYQADNTTRLRAVALSEAANDPRALGVVAQYHRTDGLKKFSGQLFVVVRDAALTEREKSVQSTDYYVAAVEVSGESPWIGSGLRLASDPNLPVSKGHRCCGYATICVPDNTTTGPCDPRMGLFCPTKDVGISSVKPPPAVQREQNGLPPISLIVYQAKTPPDIPGGQRVMPQILNTCSSVISKGCLSVKARCEPGDEGHTRDASGEVNIDSGSVSCQYGVRPPRTAYVDELPPFCAGIPAMPLPPECGGFCEACQGDSLTHRLPPGCESMHPVAGTNICKTPEQLEGQKAVNNAEMANIVCPGSAVGKRCTGEVCQPGGRSGMEICTACKNGTCGQYVRRPESNPKSQASTDDEKTAEEILWDCERRADCFTETILVVAPGPCSHASCDPKVAETPTGPETNRPTICLGPCPQPSKSSDPKPTRTPSFANKALDALDAVSKPDRAADPVLLGDGSFHIEQTDLSFEGPARPLEFKRTYNSRSRGRSTLGSNWRHNWDARIQLLTPGTTPAWALPYCGGPTEPAGKMEDFTQLIPHSAKTSSTCLLLYEGDGRVQLFFFDLGLRVFMPAAGSTDTVVPAAGGGWALRRPDGHELHFNADGYLVSDRDRFGNGFTIDYEPTPLYQMYVHYCAEESTDSRRCAVLAYWFDLRAKPDPSESAWRVQAKDYELPSDPVQAAALNYARQYFLHLLSLGGGAESVFGSTRLRPKRVVDDLGRRLIFQYHQAPLANSSRPRAPVYDFTAHPHAELLVQVNGPAGTQLRFTYSRPAKYPAELNEMFLTLVKREDHPDAADLKPAPGRTLSYRYQWPGGAALSYDSGNHAGTVYQKYLAFYETFVGCWFQPLLCPGQAGRATRAVGDPEALARQEQYGYVSDVADNIIQVISSEVVESETRFEVDPASADFDRATTQRYGSHQTRQDAPSVPPDHVTDNWQTALPKAAFAYWSAGPVGETNDSKESLPAEIQQRYPLEAEPPATLATNFTPLTPAAAGGLKACNYTLMEERRTDLPGYRKTVTYYEAEESRKHPDLTSRLYRGRLTCEQLAVEQVGDPTHNDVISTLQPILNTRITTDHTAVRITGRRGPIAANMNRICAWTRLIDRDGDIHYYGLNYRGQVLVDALRERASGQFIFTEALYNADGMVVQERRPTGGSQPWSPKDGYTSYTYDETESKGNSGWNDWIPQYWSRRANVIRIDERPAGSATVNEEEWSSTVFHEAVGRFRRFGYEPLFSQVKYVEEGSIEMRSAEGSSQKAPIDVVHSRTDYVFDYQELALDELSFKDVLDHLTPWGFGWITRNAASSAEYDYKAIASWQLPVIFFDKDLNGDGHQGFPYGRKRFERARGVPLMAIRRPTGSSVDPQVSTFIWAPHGRPSGIQEQDGAVTILEYYSVGSAESPPETKYGRSRMPFDEEVSIGFRGLLARVRALRAAATYPKAYGPPEQPCEALAGPYQWLLPSTCVEPKRELEALGLPPHAVDAILSTVSEHSKERWLTTSMAYTEIGKPSHVWTDTGATHLVRDTDGRERETTDALGTTTAQTYTVHGYPERTMQHDARGRLLGDGYREFDNEGRVTYECRARRAGGCHPPGSSSAQAGIVSRYEYWPEGRIRTAIDPEGLRTDFQYNERQLPVLESTHHPSNLSLTRQKTYSYTTDGDLASARYGSGINVLSEIYEYDGLRRVRTYRDKRGYEWQVAYSGRDLPTRYRNDTAQYGSGETTAGSWETVFRSDAFGRPVRQVDNGILTGEYSLTRSGQAYVASATGYGRTYTTYDLLGRPVWMRDAAGNQTVYAWTVAPHIRFTAQIRVDSKANRHTTTVVEELNPMGQLVKQTIHGADAVQQWTWERDGAGRVVTETGPDGSRTTYKRNVAGWVETVSQQRTADPNPKFDTALFEFNKRGQITAIHDPAGQTTSIDYDAFGAVKTRRIPGTPPVTLSLYYDDLGRVDTESTGSAVVKYQYDLRGDPVGESLLRGTRLIPLLERTFDELGRVRQSTNFNPALAWMAASDRKVTLRLDYDAIGRVRFESVQLGAGMPREVYSDWTVVPPDVWQRRLKFVTHGTTEWIEKQDSVGRLASKARVAGGVPALQTTFHWSGDAYLGRTQEQGPGRSPFREQITVGPFGRELSRQYTAIDLDHSVPVDAPEGTVYCGGAWSVTDCARPLFDARVARDVAGRVASLKQSFGYPVFQGNARVPANHARPWRGYLYNPMGQLDRMWEHDGVRSEIPTDGLRTHFVTADDIRRLGAASDQWEYVREAAVGGTLDIRTANGGNSRWSLPAQRGPGHQILQVRVDGAVRPIAYDAEARIRTDGPRAYRYDPKGRLAAVLIKGVMLESYAYDASGRLAAVFTGNQQTARLAYTIAYDGDQMVAAYDAQNRPVWEAAWGPGLDQLIEWRDHAAGTGDHIPLVDFRNSVVATWNPQQSRTTQTADYNPEGRTLLRQQDGQVACEEVGSGQVCANPGGVPFGFVSAWRSQVSGLVYMRNRWYSPNLGQFLSHDALGYGDSYNLYTYAASDPINRSDPSGLSSSGLVESGRPSAGEPPRDDFLWGFRRQAPKDLLDHDLGSTAGLRGSVGRMKRSDLIPDSLGVIDQAEFYYSYDCYSRYGEGYCQQHQEMVEKTLIGFQAAMSSSGGPPLAGLGPRTKGSLSPNLPSGARDPAGAAQSPRLAPAVDDPSGPYSLPRAIQIAGEAGVDTSNVRILVNDTMVPNTDNAGAAYGHGLKGRLRTDPIHIDELFNDPKTGAVRVFIRKDVLASKERIVHVLAHEAYEVNALYGLYNREQLLTGKLTLSAGRIEDWIKPNTAGNLHWKAWNFADRLLLRMRGKGK